MNTYDHELKNNPIYLDLEDSFLINNSIIPYSMYDGSIVFLGLEFDYNLISNLEYLLKHQVKIIQITDEEYDVLSNIYFNNKINSKGHSLSIFNSDNDSDENIEIVEYLNELIEISIIQKASDIHIEPFKDQIRIRRRIDGRLLTYSHLPVDKLSIVTTRLKILGGLEIAEKRLPQDGRITFEYKDRDVDLRIATIPVIHGEKITIRILDSGLEYNKMSNLGLEPSMEETVLRHINKTNGFILVCGPTSSGKSTTVSAMIDKINKEDINIITLEDPVEYKIPGVNQIEINYRTGLYFENTLKSILRHDPEVMWIGELRDKETIETGLRASMTGHLVFSTLHTNDSISSIFRLKDMGVENYVLSNSLTLIIAQRLIRILCPLCKESYVDKSGYFYEDTKLYRAVGCPECNNGYKGRKAVFEILEINNKLKSILNEGGSYNQILRAAENNGFTTLKEEFDKLLLNGMTSIEEYTVINL